MNRCLGKVEYWVCFVSAKVSNEHCISRIQLAAKLFGNYQNLSTGMNEVWNAWGMELRIWRYGCSWASQCSLYICTLRIYKLVRLKLLFKNGVFT